MEGYRSLIKVLPLQKNNEPMLVHYGIFYNTNEANANYDKAQSSNQSKVKRLLLEKLLPDYEF